MGQLILSGIVDRILATYDIPEKMKTDNGPPFNSSNFKDYTKKRGFQHQRVTPEQPCSNGLAENFMRMLQKVVHTAFTEEKTPKKRYTDTFFPIGPRRTAQQGVRQRNYYSTDVSRRLFRF